MRSILMLLLRVLYFVAKPVLFRLDAEKVHNRALRQLNGAGGRMIRRTPRVLDPVSFHGLDFPHRLGLAAGFFKDPEDLPGLLATQFAFAEVGSITAEAQEGNPKPRMFRFPAQQMLLNRMGFNNVGAFDALVRLQEVYDGGLVDRPIFVNLGKSKVAEDPRDAVADIASTYATLRGIGDAHVINLSSPNTPGLRKLITIEFLESLVEAMEASEREKPLLFKLHSDLQPSDFEAVVAWVAAGPFDGVICSNTTVRRSGVCGAVSALDPEPGSAGGISGAPLFEYSLPLVRTLREKLRSNQILVACGGIMGPEQAQAYLDAGADLLEAYTGWIYGGPGWEERMATRIKASR